MAEDDEHALQAHHLVVNRRKAMAQQEIYEIKDEGLDSYLQRIERSLIENALVVEGGNISKAAERLKIKRQTLQHKIKKYKVEKE